MPEETKLESLIRCGVFRCGQYFIPRSQVLEGMLPICPRCEDRMNEGIMQTLHNHGGKIRGHWHEIDGFVEE